ncbi:sensor histidine kinase [Paenibacillus sp. sptzw28]|uniref:cache domain-containing sensor histidine kinase n=1 Tax=Paenibacillus sp. sptzw28 TaxID=715179 RepID=UPI001C6EA409|nr:sensor histidine kinase [Paenibacillus sp. sptzw28]QYR19381.1 sensor histidine kinase [Paenibacillus sp. sptzw28]
MEMKSYFKLSSLGFKLFALYFVSMSISLIIMGYFSYEKSKEIIRTKVSLSALQTIDQANRHLDLLLEDYANRSNLVFGYKNIQKGILGDFQDTYEQGSNMKQIMSFMSNLVNVKNDMLNIYILGEYAASYRYSNNGFAELPPATQSQRSQAWYKEIEQAGGQIVWYGIRPSFIQQMNETGNGQVFMLGRAIKDLDGRNDIIGVLIMEFDPVTIQSFLSDIDFQVNGSTLLVDSGNAVVSDFNQRNQFRSSLTLPDQAHGVLHNMLGGKEMLTVFDRSRVNDWKLVGMAPVKELVKDSGEIGLYTLYLVLGFMAVSILLALIVARQMYKPVKMLLQSMRRVREGDFEVQISEGRKDEFGILFLGFNVMVSRIKSLIDEVYIQKLLKKETQLKMMSSQINAHFLYNTLDSIHWISRIYKADEISTMIFGLSKYLRISLSEGKEFVTVKEVSELLESYLQIQKVRYQDKFTVHMEIDPSLHYDRVLKYIFQPLVENAIYHGIEKKKEKGRLDIVWRRKGSAASCFEITDDGIGIHPGKLEEIREVLENEEMLGEHNFALKNINSQIKLAYGKEYGLTIESEYGRSTKVSLTIPLK